MARRAGGRAQQARAARPELVVSRLERHHVDALEADDVLLAAAEQLLAARVDGSGFGLVAVVDGRPVGLAGVRTGDEAREVHQLLVAPDRRRQGVATRLLSAVEELARFTGRVLVAVPEGEQAARALVEKVGYQTDEGPQTAGVTWFGRTLA